MGAGLSSQNSQLPSGTSRAFLCNSNFSYSHCRQQIMKVHCRFADGRSQWIGITINYISVCLLFIYWQRDNPASFHFPCGWKTFYKIRDSSVVHVSLCWSQSSCFHVHMVSPCWPFLHSWTLGPTAGKISPPEVLPLGFSVLPTTHYPLPHLFRWIANLPQHLVFTITVCFCSLNSLFCFVFSLIRTPVFTVRSHPGNSG